MVVEPVNWKFCTLPIWLKNGTTVSRTKRRSGETTACTVSDVPSESTVITGCCAAAKSPTTGMTLVTNGSCDVSETNACWPLNSVTFGACSTFERSSPSSACTRKKAWMSLRMAKPNEAGVVSTVRPVKAGMAAFASAVLAELNVARRRGREAGGGRAPVGFKPMTVRRRCRRSAG